MKTYPGLYACKTLPGAPLYTSLQGIRARALVAVLVPTTTLALAVSPVWASAGEIDPDVVLKCTRVTSNEERLACFDAAAGKTSQSPEISRVRPPDEEEDRIVTTQTRAAPVELGSEQLKSVAQKKNALESKSVSAVVTDLRRNAFGLYSFHLDNGQVWQQTESERFVTPDDDFQVVISRGAISGYRLHIDNQNKTLRVKRLR